jgi:branched-chain amino acid transport system ATP-binding protein
MILEVKNIVTGYNGKQVLHNVTLSVDKPQVIAVIGHNGSGKSTLLKSIFGLLKLWDGLIIYENKEIQNRDPTLNVRQGISFIPQNERIFPELSVLENLEVGGYILRGPEELAQKLGEIFDLFPVLAERRNQRAEVLSGGEQQMVALGRGLMLSPKLLLVDEPSIGLSPALVGKALRNIRIMHEKLETTILVVEQNVREVMKVADRIYILKNGEGVYDGAPNKFIENPEFLRSFFL